MYLLRNIAKCCKSSKQNAKRAPQPAQGRKSGKVVKSSFAGSQRAVASSAAPGFQSTSIVQVGQTASSTTWQAVAGRPEKVWHRFKDYKCAAKFVAQSSLLVELLAGNPHRSFSATKVCDPGVMGNPWWKIGGVPC